MFKNIFHKGLQDDPQSLLPADFLITFDFKGKLILKTQLHQLEISFCIFQLLFKGGKAAFLFGDGIF